MLSSAKKALLASTLANRGSLVVEDVFSTDLWTGNASARDITNGLDLSGEGGLVWIKDRDAAVNHYLQDNDRGITNFLRSNLTNGQDTNSPAPVTALNSDGFSLSSFSETNGNTVYYVGWSFRKAPKFFDVVLYSGDGDVGGQSISHNLGSTPGMIIVKKVSGISDWWVYHRSNTANPETDFLKLNATDATADNADIFGDTAPTDTTFYAGKDLNDSGTDNYVAYLFAHDTTDEGIIQCGSYTGNNAVDGPHVSLGWEPQYILVKSAGGTDGWAIFSNPLPWPVGQGNSKTYIAPNSSSAETGTNSGLSLEADGFHVTGVGGLTNDSGVEYIYMAIRRGPMRQPTAGTDVYNGVAGTGVSSNPAYNAGFPVDAALNRLNLSGLANNKMYARLTGANYLATDQTDAETADSSSYSFDNMEGFGNGSFGTSTFSWMFRRYPGVFDVVAYTGTGAAHTEAHNLGAVPEMIIFKNRSSAENWIVYSATLGATKGLYLNGINSAITSPGVVSDTAPTASVFTTSAAAFTNVNTSNYIAYLFATLAGISKVGSYTGDGTTGKVIDCGFTAGARFVLIKRTNSTGDWYMWDSDRGIVAGNDPHLSLNTTAAEVTTDDSVDPDSSGFIVNQNGDTNINVDSADYIFLAFA